MTSPTDTAEDFELAPPDKLYAHHRRQLSAMMDGELSPDEAKFMLRRLEHDTALAGCWERWQVCGDALRGRRNALLPADFSQRVALAIKDHDGEAHDGAAAASVPQAGPRFARWMGGGALAASVAVVALLVARQMPGDVAPVNPELPAGIVAQTPAAPAPVPVEEQAPSLPSPSSNAAATTLAAAVAVAEVPRRAAERRSRAQIQRAASRVQAHNRVEQQPVAVAGGQPAAASLATTPAENLFATRPLASSTLASDIAPARPWPRAILTGYPASDAFSAGYGNGTQGDGMASGSFDPFRPRLQRELATPPAPDADGDGENLVDAVPY